jgi:hypothetical protein
MKLGSRTRIDSGMTPVDGRIRVGRTKNCVDSYLHHQADNKNHSDAADNISVILNDEFMAQDRRVLLILLASKGLRS